MESEACYKRGVESTMAEELNSRQIKFVRNLLKGMTYTLAYTEAGYRAKSDDIAAANASRLIANDKIRAFWDAEQEKLLALSRSRIVSLAMDALPVVQGLMTSAEAPGIKLAAAKDILDRAGLQAVTKVELGSEGKVIINFIGLDEATFPDAEED